MRTRKAAEKRAIDSLSGNGERHVCFQADLVTRPSFFLLNSFFLFFFGPVSDRPNFTTARAMENETIYGDQPYRN